MAKGIKAVRIRKFRPPGLRLSDKVKKRIAKVMEGGIIENILLSRQGSGESIQLNAPKYRDYKRARGWVSPVGGGVIPLVGEKRRLIRGNGQSWVRKIGRDYIELRPHLGQVMRIVTELEEKGYTGWFDISEAMTRAVVQVLDEWVKDELKKATRKNRQPIRETR